MIGEQGEEVAIAGAGGKAEKARRTEAPAGAGAARAPTRPEPEEPAPRATAGSRRRRSPAGSRVSAESSSRASGNRARKGGSSPRTSSAPPRRPRSHAVGAAPLRGRGRQLTSIRKTIARRLTEAWQAPAFQLSMSADMTRAHALRERLREARAVTVTDLSTKLAATALLRHREVERAVDDEAILPSANVGLAVATAARPDRPGDPGGRAAAVAEIPPRAPSSSGARARRSSRGRTSRAGRSRSRTSGCSPSRVHGGAEPASGRDPRGRRDRGGRSSRTATSSRARR